MKNIIWRIKFCYWMTRVEKVTYSYAWRVSKNFLTFDPNYVNQSAKKTVLIEISEWKC